MVDFRVHSRQLPPQGCGPAPQRGVKPKPTAALKVVGLAGPGDHVTSACLLAGVLAAGGFTSGLIGRLGFSDGLELGRSQSLTPAVLAQWLRRMQANGCTHAVVELPRRTLEDEQPVSAWLDTACWTSLPAHRAASSPVALRRLLRRLLPEGVLVLNADDPGCQRHLAHVAQAALTIGIERAAEIQGRVLEQSLCEQTFLLTAGADTIPIRTQLVGLENVYRCLTAAAVGLGYGLDIVTVARGLESVQSVPHCLEPVACGQSFGVFLDAASGPRSVGRVLAAIRPLVSGRLTVILRACEGRTALDHAQLGRVAGKLADAVVVSRSPGRQTPNQNALRQVAAGVGRRDCVTMVAQPRDALALAMAQAREGDCILITGCNFNHGARHWLDRNTVEEHLRSLPQAIATARAA